MPDLQLTKNPYQRARLVFDWFRRNGGDFLYDSQQRYLLFDDVLYGLQDDPRLGCLILEQTGQRNVDRRCRKFHDYLDYFCRKEGQPVERPGWSRIEPKKDTLCVHLHDQQHSILQLRPGKVEHALNYRNHAGAVLQPIKRMRPIEYVHRADPERAVAELRMRVIDALPIDHALGWIVVSWLLTAFLHEYRIQRWALKLSGPLGSGKTTAARTLSCLLYGRDFVETRSPDYYTKQATVSPLLICDLPPSQEVDVKLGHFINAASTRKLVEWDEKGKRTKGALTGLVIVITNKPIRIPSAAARAFDVRCQPGKKLKGFSEARHLDGLIKARSLILSGIFRLFALDVLDDLPRRCRETKSLLENQFRFKELLPYPVDGFVLVTIVLRAILGVHYWADSVEERLQEVIEAFVRNQSGLDAGAGGGS